MAPSGDAARDRLAILAYACSIPMCMLSDKADPLTLLPVLKKRLIGSSVIWTVGKPVSVPRAFTTRRQKQHHLQAITTTVTPTEVQRLLAGRVVRRRTPRAQHVNAPTVGKWATSKRTKSTERRRMSPLSFAINALQQSKKRRRIPTGESRKRQATVAAEAGRGREIKERMVMV